MSGGPVMKASETAAMPTREQIADALIGCGTGKHRERLETADAILALFSRSPVKDAAPAPVLTEEEFIGAIQQLSTAVSYFAAIASRAGKLSVAGDAILTEAHKNIARLRLVSPPVTQVDHLTAEEIPLMLHQLLRSDYAEAVIAHIADLQTKLATVEGAKDILDGELKLAFDKYAEAQEQIERMRTALMQIRACVDQRTIAFKISNTALQEPIP